MTTTPVPDRLAIDPVAIERYLSDKVSSFGRLTSVDKFAGGESNPTYLVSTTKERFVLRRKPPGELLASAHAIDREFRVMQALGGTDVPVPAVYCLCEDDEIIGTSFYVMEYIEGRTFWEKDLGSLERSDRRPVVESAIKTLASLHKVSPKSVGLADFGRTTDYFVRQVRRWSKQYESSATERIPDMEWLIAWLPDAVPTGEATAIVHGDYKVDNLLLANDSPVLRAVLDWELATIGDPFADLTYFLMIWGLPHRDNLGIAGIDFAAVNIPTLDEAIGIYVDETEYSAVPDLAICMAYNMFRMGSIIQGVYRRALEGNASSQNALSYGALVSTFAANGKHWAEKAERGSV